MGSNALKRELEKRGIYNARDYAKKYTRPGVGTVERYLENTQSPITETGNWRSAPLRIAQMLDMDVAELFPEAAEERQQILDEISTLATAEGIQMTLLQATRCPKTVEDGSRPSFVLVDLTCTSCVYRVELTGTKLVCSHPGAKSL